MMTAHRIKIIDLVSQGDMDDVKELLAHSEEKHRLTVINERDEFGRNAVFMAISRNDLTMLKMLVNAGGDIQITDGFGLTACEFARQQGYVEIITFLQKSNKILNKIPLSSH